MGCEMQMCGSGPYYPLGTIDSAYGLRHFRAYEVIEERKNKNKAMTK
jgi:hypothetical protein